MALIGDSVLEAAILLAGVFLFDGLQAFMGLVVVG
jgi:hypothetical protein